MSVDGEQSIPETQLEVTVIPEMQMDAADMKKVIIYSIILSTFESNITDCYFLIPMFTHIVLLF